MPSTPDSRFFAATDIIDWHHPKVLAKALELAADQPDVRAVAARCFTFVRDEVDHSWDARRNPVTLRASEVLAHRTGYCYAKSHLLAALLRANSIAAALCYQRLSISDNGPPYCLHGLNAVWLADFGWFRVDARGNKPGISAQFAPPVESLAFAVDGVCTFDIPGLYAQPLDEVVHALTSFATIEDVFANLPDWAPATSANGDSAGPDLGSSSDWQWNPTDPSAS